MDMPIKIVVTIFVALIVGMIIINFASFSFFDAKQKLNQLNKDDIKNADKILEVTQISSRQISSLANECYKSNRNSLNNELCFVLIGKMNANKKDILSISNLNSSFLLININNSMNAIKIKYVASKNLVEISG